MRTSLQTRETNRMDIGAYIATSGALANEKVLDQVTHNLANASTPGFKERMVRLEASPFSVPGSDWTGSDSLAFVATKPPVVNLGQGVLERTGRSLDLAIEGKGYFQIQKDGGVQTARDGRLRLDGEGRIVTGEGHLVVSEQGGEIRVDVRKPVEIGDDGEVRSGERKIGRLLIVDKEGKPLNPEDYRIVQGHLERSNVNSMKEMVKMMELVRNHGSYMKVIKSFDDLEEKTIQQVGRL
jgi:flagellar basal-body rod protein FlgG